MASVIYNKFLSNLLAEYLVTGADVRVALLMTNTTADTENDAIDFVTNFTTLDECDATGYARQALTSEAAAEDDTNDRGEFDAADVVFSGLSGDATRDIQGALLYQHVTDDTDSPVIAFIDFAADVTSAATQITIPWDAEGILQASQAP